jgi:asparagine synthase (glutamine-hydrolysing)
MCGIVAAVGPATDLEGRIRSATAALRRRGPDAQGLWLEDAVSLGHTRLAINAPAEGQQPFLWGPEQRYVAVVNGEFYGSRPERGSDSWLLAEAWQQHGFPNLFAKLRGEFSWIVYDRLCKKLYAARDRFGIKPLFWSRFAGATWFASKPSALWAAGLPPAWSEEGFWRASGSQYPPLGGSLFAGVQELPPATWMCVDSDQRQESGCYWKVPTPEPQAAGDPEIFRQVLEESVALRVRPEGTTAVQLSGGIDSASVLALAHASTARGRLHAFSVDFSDPEHPEHSEGALARAQASSLGIDDHTLVSLDAEELLAGLPETVRESQGLLVNAHGVAKYRLCEEIARTGIKVVLSGEGADELLFGYQHFLPHLPGGAAEPEGKPYVGSVGLGIMSSRQGAHGLHGVERRLGFCPQVWVSKWQLGQRIQAFLRRDFLDSFAGRDPFLECLDEVGVRPEQPPHLSARQLWLSTALRSYILEVLGDGCEMAHSLEGRPPFLDHLLWETTAGIPLSATPGKILLRQVMSQEVLPAVLNRTKHPFMAPPLGQPLIRAVKDAVTSRKHEFVDRKSSLRLLTHLSQLNGPDAWEWEPALIWILSSYHLLRKTRQEW